MKMPAQAMHAAKVRCFARMLQATWVMSKKRTAQHFDCKSSAGRSEAKGTQEAPGEAMEDASSSDDAKHGRIYGEEDMAAQQQATETRGEQEQDAGNAEQAAGGERAKQRIAAWSDDDE